MLIRSRFPSEDVRIGGIYPVEIVAAQSALLLMWARTGSFHLDRINRVADKERPEQGKSKEVREERRADTQKA